MVEQVVNDIKSELSKRNHKFFDGKLPYNVNIIGVREHLNDTPNTFNDHLYLIYRDKGLRWNIRIYPITTDAGSYWLLNPMNDKGTALVKEGQYRGVWKMGMHQSRYKALVQRKPIKVYRDNNKDSIIDLMNCSVESGMFGINCHRSNPSDESFFVDKWSAGCQVFANVEDFTDFIRIVEKSKEMYGNSFTYTLIDLKK